MFSMALFSMQIQEEMVLDLIGKIFMSIFFKEVNIYLKIK